VALAGVATEYLRYGQAEGGLNDVQQLDQLLFALRFTQKKADGEVRWAVLNTITLLRRYKDLQDKVADAMTEGQSVGRIMALIEEALKTDDSLVGPGEQQPGEGGAGDAPGEEALA
jgi:hypothetical protein